MSLSLPAVQGPGRWLKGGEFVVPSIPCFRSVQIFGYVSASLQKQLVLISTSARKRSWGIFLSTAILNSNQKVELNGLEHLCNAWNFEGAAQAGFLQEELNNFLIPEDEVIQEVTPGIDLDDGGTLAGLQGSAFSIHKKLGLSNIFNSMSIIARRITHNDKVSFDIIQ
jgi:hypothetical protein